MFTKPKKPLDLTDADAVRKDVDKFNQKHLLVTAGIERLKARCANVSESARKSIDVAKKRLNTDADTSTPQNTSPKPS